ncbi:hypothetical protein KUTeg_003078 [Tegillarca granosa]|uniref:Peroxisomal membrane protein PMP34 n=1 Tax=Tegillarca granosa TaxID=220873 RepID=A0ABQ9FMW8_TEGGR|nr:hypothetical protein KUTeg_003078 [Tegillarca granosa]
MFCFERQDIRSIMQSKVATEQRIMSLAALKNVFSYENLVHALAGATGSVFALAVFYPLDTARTRLQVDDHRKAKHSPIVMAEIAKEEGITALYRGLFPVLTTLYCSNFVYFYTYNALKVSLHIDGGKPGPIKDLSFSFIAAVINVLVTAPLWVVNTRLKLQGAKFKTEKYKEAKLPIYSGIIDALWKIAKHEGLPVLWNGTMPSIVLATNPAIQFMVYETIKRYFQRLLNQNDLSGLLYFVIGAIAKTVATIATYPLQVIQSKENGIQALYKGMEAKLFQTVLTAALMFLTYEKIAAFVFKLMGHNTAKLD